MHPILEKLNAYLASATEEQLKADWEELKQYNVSGPEMLEQCPIDKQVLLSDSINYNKMRTIKFRGKDFAGTWWYGSIIQYKSGDVAIANFERYGYECSTMSRTNIDPATVGQFTSLYDKNHNEIYEGDILAAQGVEEQLEVRFVRGVFAFLWNGNLDDEFPTGSPTHEWAEVIGNIHDNPELMKGD